jgi:hypothetical protein
MRAGAFGACLGSFCAAMVLGEGVLPMPDKPASFDFGIVMTAVLIHFVLSIIYGLIGAAIVANRMGYAGAIGLGALCGLAIYSSTSIQSPRRCSLGSPWRATGSASSPMSCLGPLSAPPMSA